MPHNKMRDTETERKEEKTDRQKEKQKKTRGTVRGLLFPKYLLQLYSNSKVRRLSKPIKMKLNGRRGHQNPEGKGLLPSKEKEGLDEY